MPDNQAHNAMSENRFYLDFSELMGKTFSKVERLGDDEIRFHLQDGGYYCICHNQGCCETVEIESVVGDLDDLVGEPILMAEEVSNDESAQPAGWVPDMYCDSYTWTFYKLATRKGYVDIRWFGTSNGYYSEAVDLNFVGA